MKKLIDGINKRENLVLTICILIIFLCIISFIIINGKQSEEKHVFTFSEHLEEEVLSINTDNSSDISINLQEFSYYIIVAESNTQAQALFFREETPVNYWELKTAPLKNMRAHAKAFCIDTCVKDNILYMEALKQNLTLSDSEYEYLEDISHEIYVSLTSDQVEITSIKYSDIVAVQKKIFLAEKYILSLIDAGTITERNELSCDGAYYLEHIKPQYTIEENSELTDKLVFGSITVNIVKE